MPQRQSWPDLWLMTDERMGEALWPALERLPRGQGVIFRHYRTPDRRRIYERVRTIARRRRLVLVLAGPALLAAAWRADGAHGRDPRRRTTRPLVHTAPCHSRRELIAARAADLRLVSPVFATRSHGGVPPLGLVRTGLMIGADRSGLIALGGMNRMRSRHTKAIGIPYWAAIDGLLPP